MMECMTEKQRFEARQLNHVIVASLAEAAFALLYEETENATS